MASNSYGYSAARMQTLKSLRRHAFCQIIVQAILMVGFGVFGEFTPFSLLFIVLGAIAAGILQFKIIKEEQKLVIERLAAREAQMEADRHSLRKERISKLLSGKTAPEGRRYQALVEAGAIRPEPTEDPLNIAYTAGTKPTDETWAIFDFFFKKTEDVNDVMASNNHPEVQAKGKAFIDEEAQVVVRKLADLQAQRAREIDDVIWRSSMVIDTQ